MVTLKEKITELLAKAEKATPYWGKNIQPVDVNEVRTGIQLAAACDPDTIRQLCEALKEAREVIEFFGEPFTWSRVFADAEHGGIGSPILDNMYGGKARAWLEKWEEIK
jgi:hypothetical protein